MTQRSTLILATAAAACFATGALAQQAATPPTPVVNIRGAITAFDGMLLSVNTREGTRVTVAVPATANISVEKPFALSDIKPGMMLAVVTVPQSEGTVVALNIRPLPPTVPMSTSAYDLRPNSVMNNAVTDQVIATGGSQTITLKGKAGLVTALIVPETTMTQTTPGMRADLKVGAMVFAAARPDATGQLVAGRIEVGKDGVEPGE